MTEDYFQPDINYTKNAHDFVLDERCLYVTYDSDKYKRLKNTCKKLSYKMHHYQDDYVDIIARDSKAGRSLAGKLDKEGYEIQFGWNNWCEKIIKSPASTDCTCPQFHDVNVSPACIYCPKKMDYQTFLRKRKILSLSNRFIKEPIRENSIIINRQDKYDDDSTSQSSDSNDENNKERIENEMVPKIYEYINHNYSPKNSMDPIYYNSNSNMQQNLNFRNNYLSVDYEPYIRKLIEQKDICLIIESFKKAEPVKISDALSNILYEFLLEMIEENQNITFDYRTFLRMLIIFKPKSKINYKKIPSKTDQELCWKFTEYGECPLHSFCKYRHFDFFKNVDCDSTWLRVQQRNPYYRY